MTRIQRPTSAESTRSLSSGEAPPATAAPTTEPAARADSFTEGSQPTQTARDRMSAGHVSATPEATDPTLLATLSSERARMGRGAGAGDSGKGLNANSRHLRSGTGRIPRGDWDHPERIVGRLTQYPGTGPVGAGNAADRCAPANLLGGAIMAGPAQAQRFLEEAARNPRLSASEQRELRDVASAVGNRTATFAQLSRAQGLLYKAGNTRGDLAAAMQTAQNSRALTRGERQRVHQLYDRVVVGNGGLARGEPEELSRLLTKAHGGKRVDVQLLEDPHHPGDDSRKFWGVSIANDRSGYDDAEIQGLVTAGGGAPRQVPIDNAAVHPFEDAMHQLKPGESMTIRVSGDDEGMDADHFVTIGKRADGVPYVYNPDPARGDYTLFTGSAASSQPAAFLAEVHKYEARMGGDRDGDVPMAVANQWR